MDDALLEQARQAASERGITLTALLEEGVRLALAGSGAPLDRPHVVLPISNRTGGTLPGVDLEDTSSLLDLMEGRR